MPTANNQKLIEDKPAMPATEVKYRVTRSFKYGETEYKRGDFFEPKGGKWDEVLARTHCKAENLGAPKTRKAK